MKHILALVLFCVATTPPLAAVSPKPLKVFILPGLNFAETMLEPMKKEGP